VRRILDNLQFIIGFPVTEGTTLIMFDEIQDAPNVLNALKCFHEHGRGYHVAKADFDQIPEAFFLRWSNT